MEFSPRSRNIITWALIVSPWIGSAALAAAGIRFTEIHLTNAARELYASTYTATGKCLSGTAFDVPLDAIAVKHVFPHQDITEVHLHQIGATEGTYVTLGSTVINGNLDFVVGKDEYNRDTLIPSNPTTGATLRSYDCPMPQGT